MAESRSVQFNHFGVPDRVAEVVQTEVSPPAGNEVLVRMAYAPVNPADLNYLEGTYGKVPLLPAFAGNEGAGFVEAVGPTVTGLKPGDLVLPLSPPGLWRQRLLLPASQLIPLPKEVDPVQAAMLRVNPVTAWLLLTHFVRLRPGEWVVQNAANSAVGLAVIQLARKEGWRTLNLVRRAEAAEACLACGADAVLVESDPDFTARAAEVLAGAAPRLALNAVSGESALRLAGLLAPRGTHVTFGAMSRQKLSLPNRFLIFQELTFTGFWVSRHVETQPFSETAALLAWLAALSAAGTLRLPVEKIYPLEQVQEALRHAAQGGRRGKIVLDLTG